MIARVCNNPACRKVIMTAYCEAEVDIDANWPADSIQIKGAMKVHAGDKGAFGTCDVDYCNVKCLAEDIACKSEEH